MATAFHTTCTLLHYMIRKVFSCAPNSPSLLLGGFPQLPDIPHLDPTGNDALLEDIEVPEVALPPQPRHSSPSRLVLLDNDPPRTGGHLCLHVIRIDGLKWMFFSDSPIHKKCSILITLSRFLMRTCTRATKKDCPEGQFLVKLILS